jgi:hypothetical protein
MRMPAETLAVVCFADLILAFINDEAMKVAPNVSVGAPA